MARNRNDESLELIRKSISNQGCHSERSEESRILCARLTTETLRCAQGDRTG